MRSRLSTRVVLGLSMMVVGCGLMAVGLRDFLHRGTSLDRLALDGASVVSPAEYLVPWALAVMLVLASCHVLHQRSRDELF